MIAFEKYYVIFVTASIMSYILQINEKQVITFLDDFSLYDFIINRTKRPSARLS